MDYYEDVRRVATIIGLNTVPYEAYRRHGKYAAEHIFSRFGKWNDFLVKAGLDKTGFSKDKITEQDCFNEIERIWRILGRQPTSTDIIKSGISKYSIDTFKRRFGGWRNALEAFVEYINTDDDASYEPCQNKSSNSLSKETVIIERDDTNKTVKHITSRNINTRLRFKVLQRGPVSRFSTN